MGIAPRCLAAACAARFPPDRLGARLLRRRVACATARGAAWTGTGAVQGVLRLVPREKA